MLNLVFAAALHAASAAAPVADLTTLRAADQALLDAIAPGDQALWDRTLTADAVYIDENGEVFDRAAYLKQLTPLPPGASGRISIIDYQGVVHGDVAIIRHRDDEREDYHSQKLHAEYLMSETWLRQVGVWKLAMVHVYVVPVDPPAVPLSASEQDRFIGRYVMADLTYTIGRDGDHLTGVQGSGRPHPLLAETADVLFTPGRPRTRLIFKRDQNGEVVQFIDRREGEDLVWTRAPS